MNLHSKKGKLFFSVILAVIMLIIILPLSINVSKMKISKFKNYMGDSQILLLRTYEKGEKFLYYIDQSAKLALKETVYSYLEKKDSALDCGVYFGYNKWNTDTKTCYPEIKKDIITSFKTNFKNYISSYPELADINYEFLLAKEGDDSKIIGVAKEEIKIAVSKKEDYNLMLEEKKEEVEEEPEVIDNPITPTINPPITSSGKCGFVVDYAMRYAQNRCLYSLTNVAILTPENCNTVGLTCATFVSSSYYFTIGNFPYGNGNAKCDGGNVMKIGTDPSKLQPGDIFATEYLTAYGTYTPWGHTGMYVGRGYVSNYDGSFCYRTFTPNSKGEYVFIHSYGGSNLGKPGVCYDTYTNLFSKPPLVLTSFCRHVACV